MMKRWWLAPANILEFWMPQSGFLGGILSGLIVLVILSLLGFIEHV